MGLSTSVEGVWKLSGTIHFEGQGFFFFETFLWDLHGIAKLEFVWLQDRYLLQLFLLVFVVVLTCQLTLLKSWVSFDFDFRSLLVNCGYFFFESKEQNVLNMFYCMCRFFCTNESPMLSHFLRKKTKMSIFWSSL